MGNLSQNGWLFAGVAAAATLITTGWSYLRGLYSHAVSRVVLRITVDGDAGQAVQLYLNRDCQRSQFGHRWYSARWLFVRSLKQHRLVAAETLSGEGKLFWQGWVPIWAKLGDPKTTDGSVELTVLRGTVDPDGLVRQAVEIFSDRNRVGDGHRRHCVSSVSGRLFGTGEVTGTPPEFHRTRDQSRHSVDVRSHRLLGYDQEDIGPGDADMSASLNHLSLSPEAERLVSEASWWMSHENWYKDRGIPWRRGWLLYGRPGTGKTALARATAEALDLPVFVYDLGSLSNPELLQAWQVMLASVPCMAVIEDIDSVFDGRTPVNKTANAPLLTFDCLLNCIDGVQKSDGLLLIISTNCLDKVDPALACSDDGVSRPGRIDRVIELRGLDTAGRLKVAQRILKDWPEDWDMTVAAGDGETAAQFTERCLSIAWRRMPLSSPPASDSCTTASADATPDPQ